MIVSVEEGVGFGCSKAGLRLRDGEVNFGSGDVDQLHIIGNLMTNDLT